MKKRKKYKILVWSLVILVSLLLFEALCNLEKVVFMSVGQGDASVIYTKERTILIDGGPNWNVLLELSKVLKYRMKIDDLIITHPHSDHYFGLTEVIRRYKIDNVYYYDKNKGSDDFNIFLNNIKNQDINLVKVSRGDKIKIRKDCSLYFLWPKEEEYRRFDVNELSIINYFSCGKQKILFTGDISEAVEKQLISMDNGLEFKVLKAAHHGSNKSNSWDFLKFYSPKKIVISAGKGNKYRLPSPELLKRVEALNIRAENLIEGESYEILIK